MSPLPVRCETKASCLPSGEYNGRDSVAECETNSRASPPAAGAVQISPPETNAISERSGEMHGSAKEGLASMAGASFSANATRSNAKAATLHRQVRRAYRLNMRLSKCWGDDLTRYRRACLSKFTSDPWRRRLACTRYAKPLAKIAFSRVIG